MPISGVCQNCRQPSSYAMEGGRWRQVGSCGCDGAPAAPRLPVPALPRTAAQAVAVRQALGKGRKHYAAVRTPCAHGHSHDSKGEARVCDELHRRFPRVFVRVPPMPLLTSGPKRDGRPCTLKVDFCCVLADGTREWFDAKHPTAPERRGWEEKRCAFEATYGVTVREVWVTERGEWQELA